MAQRVLEPFTWAPGDGRLDVAVRRDPRTHAAGIAWRLMSATSTSSIHLRTLRRSRTLMAAELSATREGLRAASRSGVKRLLVPLEDLRLVALLRGGASARFRRVRASLDHLRPILSLLSEVRFEALTSPDTELVHAAEEALDRGIHAAALDEEHRRYVMQRIVARARTVQLRRTESGWIANDRYHVQLDPMRCECPAWSRRWAGVPVPGRRARRLPCKHIVALALHEGLAVPADLSRLARKAPA